jgi:hypothetical protein
MDGYFQRIAHCRTLNELNAVHIAACNLMTPVEALMVYRKMASPTWQFPTTVVGPETAAALGNSLLSHMTMMVNDLTDAGKDQPEPFRRVQIANGVWGFGASRERTNKTLLLCFTGNSDRLMMPSPTFLQHFDPMTVDVVFMVDRNKCGFRDGISEVGDSLATMVDALPKLLAIGDYAKLAVIGTSGGGLAAVLGGLRLKADAIMAIGGTNPEDSHWSKMKGGTAIELLAKWAPESPESRITLVIGAQSPRDRVAAEATLKLIKAELIEVSDPDGPVKHNAAYPLVRQKKFTAFARQYLELN